MLCIKNGALHTASNADARMRTFSADVLIDAGKIQEIGINLSAPDGCEVVDATGLHIYPGFVEAHCHTGLDGTAVGYEGHDYNELNDPVTPSFGRSTASTLLTLPFMKPPLPALPASPPVPEAPMPSEAPLPSSKQPDGVPTI